MAVNPNMMAPFNMTAESINSISEFLLQAGTEYRVYDMGRGISELPAQAFLDIESNVLPVPRPRAKHAWFGIVFWNKQLNHDHYLWFVKFPIDEQSLLIRATRNQFLEIVTNALGKQLEHASERQAELPENPFVFTPSQQQLSDLNAITKRDLGLQTETSAQAARHYFHAPAVHVWQDLSLQNISDYAVWMENQRDEHLVIASNIDVLAPAARVSLFNSIENITLDTALVQGILDYASKTQDVEQKSVALRALTNQAEAQLIDYIDALISDPNVSVDELVTIAGRFFILLADPARLEAYLTRVSLLDDNFALFKGIYMDLVYLPVVRHALLSILKKENKPKALEAAVADLITEFKAKI